MGSLSEIRHCEVCGHTTGSPTLRCSNCHQVESRFEEYIENEAGRAYVYHMLAKQQGAIDKMGRMKKE